jgi:hypothetical protein
MRPPLQMRAETKNPGLLQDRGLYFSSMMETAGIEPASAVARNVTSTSVSGALFSSHARLAGGVAWDQLPEDVPGSAGADLPG